MGGRHTSLRCVPFETGKVLHGHRMNSIYSKSTIRRILSEVDALDVLELIDFHPETISRDGGRLRAACPIHRDAMFRTLVVENSAKSYRCSKSDCPGHEGGDLVDLLARARKIGYDDALKVLIEEFMIEVDLPEDSQALDEAMSEVRTQMDLMRANPENALIHGESARIRLEEILATHGDDLEPLRLRVELAREQRDERALKRWLPNLAAAEDEDGERVKFEALVREYLDLEPNNLPFRRRLAIRLIDANREDEAVEQLMMLADVAEMAGELGTALEAYRLIAGLGDTGIDPTPMIDNLLLALGNREEAAREMLARAEQQIARRQYSQAMALLETAMEANPSSPVAAQRFIELVDQFALSPAQLQRALAMVDRMMNARWWEEARDGLVAIAEQYPEDTGVLARLARAHEGTGALEMAQEIRNRLIETYRRTEDFRAAREVLDAILEASPRDKEALRQYGEIAAEEVDFDAAIIHFRSLGQILEEEGDFEEAEKVYRQMMVWRGGDARTCASLVQLLQQNGRGEEVIALLEEAIGAARAVDRDADIANLVQLALSVDSTHPAFLMESARILEQGGDETRGREQRVKACRFLIREKKFAEAERHAKRMLEERPGNVEAIEVLAEALVAQGRGAEARQLLTDSVGTLQARGQLAGAKRILEKLIDDEAPDPEILARYTEVCAAIGEPDALTRARQRFMAVLKQKRRLEEAVVQAEALVELQPYDVGASRELLELYRLTASWDKWEPAAMRLAGVLRAAGDTKGEAKVLREILKQQPQHVAAREALLEVLVEIGSEAELISAVDDYRTVCERLTRNEDAVVFLTGLVDRAPGNTALRQRLIDLFGTSDRAEDQAEQIGKLLETLEARGAVDEMIPLYKSLVQIRPSDLEARRRLADLLVRAERMGDAREVLLAIGRESLANDEADDAVGALESLLDRLPEDEEGLQLLARAEIARDNAVAGAKALRTLANIRIARGDLGTALVTFADAVNADPNNAELRRDAANACRAEGTPWGATEALAHLDWLADYWLARGDENGAFEAAREAIELDPDNEARRRRLITQLIQAARSTQAQEELADLAEWHRALGDIDRALAVLDESVALDKDHVRTRSIRAELLEEVGDEKGALAEWRALAPLLREAEPAPPQGRTLATGLQVLPEYTFDQFVVSEHNRFAHATAVAVAKAPGQTPHNPLFLHADVGLGKTHILHAIANHVFREFPHMQVLYTNAEDFTTELVEAISSNTIAAFRQKHKGADLLLIDDIQFLAGNESAQNEFFHVFNTLYQAKKQIVISSDRPPRALEHLEKRLKSRFGAGVIVDIQHPDIETRLAILMREARERQLPEIGEETLRVLAQSFEQNIRELKGAFNQLLLRHDVGGEPLDPATARKVVENYE
jgi:chromosomal replication initiation ATPase DnaA/DNA-binding SARP family transcriptional activator